MNGVVCLTPSKWGQCTFLAGHTGPHRSPSGYDWKENITWSIQKKQNIEPAPVETPVKRGPGRPRKWFKDENGKWYKKE